MKKLDPNDVYDIAFALLSLAVIILLALVIGGT